MDDLKYTLEFTDGPAPEGKDGQYVLVVDSFYPVLCEWGFCEDFSSDGDEYMAGWRQVDGCGWGVHPGTTCKWTWIRK